MNPKLTLPYWDFTIEDYEAEMSFNDDDLKIDSPIFQEDWFGSADPVDNVVSVVLGVLFWNTGGRDFVNRNKRKRPKLASMIMNVDRYSGISEKPGCFVLSCGAVVGNPAMNPPPLTSAQATLC